MKTIFKYAALLLVMVGCSKLSDKGGTYTISGRLLNNCEDQQPVANQLLYFLVDVDSDEEDRVAYTDAKGNFSYTFDGPPNNNSSIGGSIRIQNDKPILCGIPSSGLTADKEMDAGSLYVSPPIEASVTFKVQGVGYSNLDTLVIARAFHSDLNIISDFKISGPFDNGVEVTRDWIKYASSEPNNMTSYVTMNQPYVKRFYGTYGTYCRWQVNRSNNLGDVQKEFVLLDACENEATLTINLPEAQ